MVTRNKTTRTRKQSTVETTAIVAPPPAIGDNNPPVETPVEPTLPEAVADPIIAAANAAFEDAERGKQLAGSSVQRMTHAIFLQHTAWTISGTKVVSLADCADIRAIPSLNIDQHTKSDNGTGALLTALKKRFVTLKLDGLANSEYQTIKAKITARNALVSRALTLAGKLALCGYTDASFSTDSGTFTVHKNLILPADGKWDGFMGDSEPADKLVTMIPLDGASYGYQVKVAGSNGYQPRSVAASVEAFNRATAIVADKIGDDGTTTPTSTEAREPNAGQGAIVVDLSKGMDKVPHGKLGNSVVWALVELHTCLIKTEADGADMTGAFTAEQWSMFSDLAQWSDKVQSMKGFVKDALDKELAMKKAA